MKEKNKLKRKLNSHEKPLGLFFDTASVSVMECIGRTGFDFVIIDNEHSPIDAETSCELIRAAELTGITPLARVREISRPAILKLLDVGAQGLIVPNVSTVDEVRELVSYCKYSPVGNRGFCPSRKDGWGFDSDMSVDDTMAYFNESVLLIPQCETVGALKHIEEIVWTDGVDGIFIGPFDLSISMGIPGMFDAPEFKAALERIRKAVHSAGKFCIMFAGTPEKALEAYRDGCDSVAYSLDASLIIAGMREKVGTIRKGLEG